MVLYFSVKSWGFFFSFLNLSIKCSPPFNLSILISLSFQFFYPSLSSLFLVVFSFESDHGLIVISCLIEGTRFAEITEQSKHREDLNLGLSIEHITNIMEVPIEHISNIMAKAFLPTCAMRIFLRTWFILQWPSSWPRTATISSLLQPVFFFSFSSVLPDCSSFSLASFSLSSSVFSFSLSDSSSNVSKRTIRLNLGKKQSAQNIPELKECFFRHSTYLKNP